LAKWFTGGMFRGKYLARHWGRGSKSLFAAFSLQQSWWTTATRCRRQETCAEFPLLHI